MKLLLENWREYMNESIIINIGDTGEIIDEIGEIKIRLVDSVALHDEKYIGCHHYGKKCEHIPVNEIWISNKIPEEERDAIINHELIEREIMKMLEEEFEMTPEEAWEIAHPLVDKIGDLKI
jgi:hypothetical protein